MKPSWVRAHGLIFGKVYIVWVCAPPYSPLSSPRSRIRENSALKFGPNFVTHSGGIFYPVVFFNSVHPVIFYELCLRKAPVSGCGFVEDEWCGLVGGEEKALSGTV